MRWKLTCGSTFWSTRAMTLRISPDWIVLSAFTASSTSVETSLMSGSGALPAWAGAPTVASESIAAASQPIVLVMDIVFPSDERASQHARARRTLLAARAAALVDNAGGPRPGHRGQGAA